MREFPTINRSLFILSYSIFYLSTLPPVLCTVSCNILGLEQSTPANWPIIDLGLDAAAIWLSITSTTNPCYIVTAFRLFLLLYTQRDQALKSWEV